MVLFYFLLSYIVANIGYMLCTIGFDEADLYKLLPWDFHESTEMNWLGSIITSIVTLILFPPVWIGRFIYWLFHVKKDNINKYEN